MSMHWHTNLDHAIQDARQRRRPILSLALLGRLDEALSCANSRFFKLTIYPDPAVAAVMNESFVLHWASVCPVPKVTIDFGGGRVVIRTVTGNSAHLVLDQEGRVLDAIPGVYTPQAFIRALTNGARAGERPAYHRECLQRIEASGRDRPSAPPARLPTAREAGALTMTKMRMEEPLLRLITTLGASIAEDTWINEHQLHRQIHEALANHEAPTRREAFVEWLYETVFLMPLSDPWLGLRSGPFSEL